MNVVILTNRPASHIVHHTENSLSSERRESFVTTVIYDSTTIPWLEMDWHKVIIDVDNLKLTKTSAIIKSLLKKRAPLSIITDLKTEYDKTD